MYSEAVSRIDTPAPIFWMVAEHDADQEAVVRLGENAYFSGLFIDADNRLALVHPALSVEDMRPTCACCTHTFNGERFTQPYTAEE